MPFVPLRLLLAYDPEGGLCARVVPRMREMLEQRGFDVQVTALDDGALPSLDGLRGVVLGSPVVGLGLRRLDPSVRVARFVQEAPGLQELRVAVFTVFRVRAGDSSERLRTLVRARGADVVVDHAYAAWAPERNEHMLPAECMVRIR